MSNVLTPKFRVSYPNLFRARKNDLNGKDEYSVVALFPKNADLSKVKAAIQEAVIKKWGSDKKKWPAGLRTPLRDQKERGKENDEGKLVLPAGYEEGALFLNLKTERKPGLVGLNVEAIIDETEIYAGCYGRASINAYAYDQKGNKGVAFGLVNFQKMGDGDPISGVTKPQDDFSPVADESAVSGKTADNMSASDIYS